MISFSVFNLKYKSISNEETRDSKFIFAYIKKYYTYYLFTSQYNCK